MSWVFCDGCFSQGGIRDTVEGAFELWNRRAERTCHAVPMDSAGNPPYRTSDVIFNLMDEGCSDCGSPWRTGYFGIPNYCPHCGAKVMDDD